VSDHAGNQAVLFQRLRWRQLHNGAEILLRTGRMRLATVGVCSLVICIAVFAAFVEGFFFLRQQQVPFAGSIIGLMFDCLFLSLAVMLIFSSGLILYSSLFAAAETTFLLSTPAAADQVFAYKFQGALAFSSWAFVLLGGPVFLAYGIVFDVPWPFFALLPLFVLGFVLLPGSIGALLCLLLVNIDLKQRKQIVVLTIIAVLIVAGVWAGRTIRSLDRDMWDREFIQQLVSQISFAQSSFSPSHWMTRGLQAAARNDLGEAGYRLALVWSNGLFLYLLAAAAARRLYRRAYNRCASGGFSRRSRRVTEDRDGNRVNGAAPGEARIDRALTRLLFFFDPQTRLLIIKDFRTFRRDPAQWAQVVLFTGLLLLYFANTRSFYQEDVARAYQNGISLLNLASTALLLCVYTSRFIYPLLSLEGRKFWILGLLPLRRERLLWGKFAFSATGALVSAELLVLLSDLSLRMPREVVALHALTVAVLAVGLSGLSVGLGAWLPNFRETDPSKIAVGFGGTLNLVASLLFLVLVLGLMAAPSHVVGALGEMKDMDTDSINGWLAAGVVAGVGVGVAAVVLPLRLGIRTLRAMEF
jgi:ABC-2 type transport system permease protein